MNLRERFIIVAILIPILLLVLSALIGAYLFLVKDYRLIAPPSDIGASKLPQYSQVTINRVSGEVINIQPNQIKVKTNFGYEYLILLVSNVKIYSIAPQGNKPLSPDVESKKTTILISQVKIGDFVDVAVFNNAIYKNNEIFAKEITVYPK